MKAIEILDSTRVRKLFFVDLQKTYFNDSYAKKSY